jgi:hypothetical protein
MKLQKPALILILLMSLLSNVLYSQTLSVKQYEDSLASVFSKLVNAGTDKERFELNGWIDKMFNQVLKDKNSIRYSFDKLNKISKLSSDDGLVKLFNWNIQLENGDFIYFCYVQHFDKQNNIELYRLEDKSASIKNPEFTELSEKNWFGALYYKIISNSSGKSLMYTLLGWDGNDNFTNKKLIETFTFSDKKLVFGPPVFKIDQKIQNRMIFEYGEQVKMMLRYDDKLGMVVFDHLAPSHTKFEGQYMYYGPDMSQDGIQFKDGLWEFKANLDLRNMDPPTGKSIEKSF